MKAVPASPLGAPEHLRSALPVAAAPSPSQGASVKPVVGYEAFNRFQEQSRGPPPGFESADASRAAASRALGGPPSQYRAPPPGFEHESIARAAAQRAIDGNPLTQLNFQNSDLARAAAVKALGGLNIGQVR